MGDDADPVSGSDETHDQDDGAEAGEKKLQTNLTGIEVTTQLSDGDVETLEAVHRRQLEWALEHAEEAKEATRL